MRKVITIMGTAAIFAALALAENWSGRLIDASCTDRQKADNACQPSSTTTTFALDTAGHVYKLDEAGNAKAVLALKERADRLTDPNSPGKNTVVVKISGTKDGDIIKVDTLDVQ